MTSGKEALKWVADGKVLPDLILLDCMMPGMSGSLPHPLSTLIACMACGRVQRAQGGQTGRTEAGEFQAATKTMLTKGLTAFSIMPCMVHASLYGKGHCPVLVCKCLWSGAVSELFPFSGGQTGIRLNQLLNNKCDFLKAKQVHTQPV